MVDLLRPEAGSPIDWIPETGGMAELISVSISSVKMISFITIMNEIIIMMIF